MTRMPNLRNQITWIIFCGIFTILLYGLWWGRTNISTKWMKPEFGVIHHLPYCDNILSKATKGKWVNKISLIQDKNSREYANLMKEEERLDKHLAEFRLRRGIHKKLWRDDGKCGTKNLGERPPNSGWIPTSSWCNAKSTNSCCSNKDNGICVDPSHFSNCECPGCVDLRKIYHADISEWVPDEPCRLRNFTAIEACDLLETFEEVHFVGDSFMRKVYREFVLIMTGDPEAGGFVKNMSPNMKKLCVGDDQFFWSECKGIGNSLDDLLNINSLCEGRGKSSLKIFSDVFYNVDHGPQFIQLVKRLTGTKRSLIILGVGMHNGGNIPLLNEKYLGPAIQHIKMHYENSTETRWPQIIFATPDMPGILKQPPFLAYQARQHIDKFSDGMKIYCDQHDMKFMDFRHVTTGVHSYDGTHHGMAVNMVKAQILLNYFLELRSLV